MEATVKKKVVKKATTKDKNNIKEIDKKKKKAKKIASIEDVLIILKANKPKQKVVFKSIEELVKAIKNSKPRVVTVETIKPEIENLSKVVNTVLKKELTTISQKQEELVEAIKTVKNNKPSQKIITFFKKHKIDLSKPTSFFLESQLDSIEEGLNDKDFIENLKKIPKSNNAKLKKAHTRFKPFLNKEFLNKLKIMELELNDEVFVMPIMMQVSSFIDSVKYFIPNEGTSKIKEL
ncbi:hypothetical protein MBM09_00290 [Flaviramulus sp. BrNp1-15]|uniref:hypothetical protein n=1 Tax=Flaviramulus sp. BrNp1-15 TaxID=2916754 RepID=UPI001EE87D70|nr:hypothetical protein [Flaviramulus sp. BrNp1-15]ULC59434.1 hypothetical protein MBM09_00290 [Flaviramulus sp. BrNp1-15]